MQMTSSTSHSYGGTQKRQNDVNNDVNQPAEQDLQGSDRSSSPGRLGTTKAVAATPDSADRASGGFRPRPRSVSSEGSTDGGSSRLRDLRSQRNAKLGVLEKKIKSSHTTLSTSARNIEPGSEVNNIMIGNSANAQNVDHRLSPTPRLDELHAMRKQRLEEIGTSSHSAEGAPPPFIGLSGTDVPARETPPTPIVKASDNKRIHSPVRSVTRSAQGRMKATRRRSSAPNVYKGMSEEMFSDFSKLNRLRQEMSEKDREIEVFKAKLHRIDSLATDNQSSTGPSGTRIPEKAQLANANISGSSEESSESVIQDSVRSVAHSAPGRRKNTRRRSSAPNMYKGIPEEMFDDEAADFSKLNRLRKEMSEKEKEIELFKAKLNKIDSLTTDTQSCTAPFGAQIQGKEKEIELLKAQLNKSDSLRTLRADTQSSTNPSGVLIQEKEKEIGLLKAKLNNVDSLTTDTKSSEEKRPGTKTTTGEDNDTFGMSDMIDELQGQVDKLEDEKIQDNIQLEEAMHKARLEVMEKKEQLEAIEFTLSQVKRDNLELNHRNEQQQVRHSNVTKMWERRAEGLVSQLSDLQYSLQDLSRARLQERSDLLRHIVLLQKENQRLRNGGIDKKKENSRGRFWKSVGNSFTLMPFGSSQIERHRTLKVTGDTWRPLKTAEKSKRKSHSGVSTFVTKCTGLMTWDTVKNVAWGAGIMGLVIMSNDPQATRDVSPFFRLELSV